MHWAVRNKYSQNSQSANDQTSQKSYFGHNMQTSCSLKKSIILGKVEGKEEEDGQLQWGWI